MNYYVHVSYTRPEGAFDTPFSLHAEFSQVNSFLGWHDSAICQRTCSCCACQFLPDELVEFGYEHMHD